MQRFMIGLGLAMGIAPAVSTGAPPPTPSLEMMQEPTWHGKTLQQWLRVLNDPDLWKRLRAIEAIGEPQPNANERQKSVAAMALRKALRSGDLMTVHSATGSMSRLGVKLTPAERALLRGP